MLRNRFSQDLDPVVAAFVASTDADARLVPHDIEGSLAHVRMLGSVGLLTRAEQGSIVKGLEQIRGEWNSGAWKLSPAYEDVHMNVEKRLEELIGEPARKLHTARSRNDQVALDLRLYARKANQAVQQEIRQLIESLSSRVPEFQEAVLPATTHLQRAQPTTMASVLGAYRAMLERDFARASDVAQRIAVSPLGAGAVAGTTLPIEPKQTASALGMQLFANPLDAVGDRDFAAEFVFNAALLLTHLSQMAEQFILWMTPEFGFIDLPDALCTTSSMMPQKKNPDALELVRAKAALSQGWTTAMLGILKGLTLGYNRDLQETKPLLFAAADAAVASLKVCVLAVSGFSFNANRARDAASDPALLATDLAEYLVAKRVPFRDAHRIVAGIMRDQPKKFTLEILQAASALFEADVLELLDPVISARRRLK